MAITMPNIDITFKQKATSLIERSTRGIAILILKADATTGAPTYKEYTQVTDLETDKALYTTENYNYIKDILGFVINKVIIINEDTVSDSLAKVESYASTGWITVAGGTTEDFTTLNTWVKSENANKNKTYKCVSYKTTGADSMHVVNFVNDKVTFVDSRGEVTGEHYCPSLIGILASCNITKGSTYFKCSNLSKVTEVADRNVALQAGDFILVNDGDYVRIGQGINSLTTTNGTTQTEDMKFIETVECIDLIEDDIRSTFKTDYLGNYKNKLDNQMLLISAIKGYFKNLANTDILDEEYENKAEIDVEAQRDAWVATGKAEVATYTDAKVKQLSFKRSVFLNANIKILGSMTDLKFTVNLF